MTVAFFNLTFIFFTFPVSIDADDPDNEVSLSHGRRWVGRGYWHNIVGKVAQTSHVAWSGNPKGFLLTHTCTTCIYMYVIVWRIHMWETIHSSVYMYRYLAGNVLHTTQSWPHMTSSPVTATLARCWAVLWLVGGSKLESFLDLHNLCTLCWEQSVQHDLYRILSYMMCVCVVWRRQVCVMLANGTNFLMRTNFKDCLSQIVHGNNFHWSGIPQKYICDLVFLAGKNLCFKSIALHGTHIHVHMYIHVTELSQRKFSLWCPNNNNIITWDPCYYSHNEG